MALALSLHHVSLNVRDLARSLHFYTDVLGLEQIPRPALRVEGAWLGIGTAQIHLITFADGQGDVGLTPSNINAAAPHVAISIDDYAAAVTHLQGAGLEVVEAGPQRRQCWVQDPDGYVIEFIAHSPVPAPPVEPVAPKH